YRRITAGPQARLYDCDGDAQHSAGGTGGGPHRVSAAGRVGRGGADVGIVYAAQGPADGIVHQRAIWITMRHFDEQLQDLLQKVVLMGSLAESMISKAISSLVTRNLAVANEVFAKEQEVNALQVEVDDTAVKLTVLQQPVASDARFLFMASRIGGEL